MCIKVQSLTLSYFRTYIYVRNPKTVATLQSKYGAFTANLTNGLLINYTRIVSAFNTLSENIYFYILTLTIKAVVVVFDLLRAIAEY